MCLRINFQLYGKTSGSILNWLDRDNIGFIIDFGKLVLADSLLLFSSFNMVILHSARFIDHSPEH
jgi:hypothetical protein